MKGFSFNGGIKKKYALQFLNLLAVLLICLQSPDLSTGARFREHSSFLNDLSTRFAASHLHLSAKFERNWTWNSYLPAYPRGQA